MTDEVLEVVEVVDVEVEVEVEDDEDDDMERTDDDEEEVADVVSADNHTRQINSDAYRTELWRVPQELGLENRRV